MVRIEKINDVWLATITKKIDGDDVVTAQYYHSLPDELQIAQLKEISATSSNNVGRLSVKGS